jgi:hypothetical protein
MKQYRIIEVYQYEKDVYYVLQIRKRWLFWETVKEITHTHNGQSVYGDESKFTSREGAKKYFMKYYMKEKRTVVETN